MKLWPTPATSIGVILPPSLIRLPHPSAPKPKTVSEFVGTCGISDTKDSVACLLNKTCELCKPCHFCVPMRKTVSEFPRKLRLILGPLTLNVSLFGETFIG